MWLYETLKCVIPPPYKSILWRNDTGRNDTPPICWGMKLIFPKKKKKFDFHFAEFSVGLSTSTFTATSANSIEKKNVKAKVQHKICNKTNFTLHFFRLSVFGIRICVYVSYAALCFHGILVHVLFFTNFLFRFYFRRLLATSKFSDFSVAF